MTLHLADVVVLVVYCALTLGLGLYFSRRQTSTDNYFLGGRNFPGWALGLSLIGAMVSSVTFIAFPADAYKTAWVRLVPNLAFPVVVLIAAFMFIPFFRRGTVASAYHYLSLRFGPSVAAYGAIVFLVAQLIRTATVTYLLAVLLAPMTGLSVEWCILLSGGVTAVYTIKGGYEAVVWTDVIQTVILVLGAVVCIWVVTAALPGGLAQIWTEAMAAGKLSFMDLNTATGRLEPCGVGFSLSEKTMTMLFLVGFAQYVAGKLDQTTVQRWCSARSAREARKSMLVLGIGSLPIWAVFMFLGTCLWVYFQHFPTGVSQAVLAGTRKAEEILPFFIMTTLPPGLAGLVIAAALAAAMSTLSSCVNAAGMVWVNDLYRLYIAPGRADAHYLRAGRLASLVVSVFMVGGAYLCYRSDAKTIMEFGIIVTALFGGGITGAFLFGMLTRLGDARAVLAGIGATVLFTLYALLMEFRVLPRTFNPYYTSILGNLVMFGACYAAARLFPAPPRDLRNLTVWDQSTEPLV
jgi:SSS family solute:Na+ symporter